MCDLDEVIKEFLIESHENLDQLDRDLIALENDAHRGDSLANIFRTLHTIKGTCGFFDFAKLGALTHAGENLLSRLREGALAPNPEITSALLALVDAVRALLSNIEKTGQEGDADYSALLNSLTRLSGNAGFRTEQPSADVQPAEAAHEEGRNAAVSDSTIRVDVGLLDKLMNLVGELVLARNQVLQLNAAHQDPAFLSTSQRLNLITTELQEGVMKTRMQSIGTIWNKLPRMVRDLALACGKQVRLEMVGQDTELDRSIMEAIKDPLIHLVRNAVDHGVESAVERQPQGKPAEGLLCLRAFHEGGQVNIEIADDGAGINAARIKQRAQESGLISADQAARLSDREVLNLIFLPGFSTAERITTISGRGVGMDVVKTNIEKIGGTMDVHSRPGHGTTIKIKIPLTLAIIPVLLVTSGGDPYAIPQVNLLEVVRLEGQNARRGIENIHGTPVYRLRGNLLPLVYLDRELRVQEPDTAHQPEAPARAALAGASGCCWEVCNIVVLQADNRQFGLVVERIHDTEEIVVKPLGKALQGIPVFAGATILGDGRVALILDVLGLAQSAGVISGARQRKPAEATATGQDNRCQTLLLLGLVPDRRLALPLSAVARLEEVPIETIERAGACQAIQYREGILPLIHLCRLLPGYDADTAPEHTLQVVVLNAQGGNVGLVVDRILDIVEAPLAVPASGRRPGILGSTIIQQRVTDLLDVAALARAAEWDLVNEAQPA